MKIAYEEPLTEVHLLFYTALFTNYNLFLQRVDPAAHIVYPMPKELIRKIVSRFLKTTCYHGEDIIDEDIIDDADNYLPLNRNRRKNRRVEIGDSSHTRFSRVSKSKSALLLCYYCTVPFYFVCCMALTLFICGDVELNPGPKNTKSYYFSLCHWNLNSLSVHDFSKLSLIETYSTHHSFNMICLSETNLESSYDDDTRLNLK